MYLSVLFPVGYRTTVSTSLWVQIPLSNIIDVVASAFSFSPMDGYPASVLGMCILICSVRWNNVAYPPHQYHTELRRRHKFYCYPRHSSQGFSFLWACSALPIFQSPMVTLPAQVTNETSSISDARVVRSLQLQSCGSNSAAGDFSCFFKHCRT